MLYFVFKEIFINDKYWSYAFIGIKEIKEIPKKFTYSNIFNSYSYNINKNNHDSIVLVSIKDLNMYLVSAYLIYKKDLWDEYFKEYLKTNYPEILLMINLSNL